MNNIPSNTQSTVSSAVESSARRRSVSFRSAQGEVTTNPTAQTVVPVLVPVRRHTTSTHLHDPSRVPMPARPSLRDLSAGLRLDLEAERREMHVGFREVEGGSVSGGGSRVQLRPRSRSHRLNQGGAIPSPIRGRAVSSSRPTDRQGLSSMKKDPAHVKLLENPEYQQMIFLYRDTLESFSNVIPFICTRIGENNSRVLANVVIFMNGYKTACDRIEGFLNSVSSTVVSQEEKDRLRTTSHLRDGLVLDLLVQAFNEHYDSVGEANQMKYEMDLQSLLIALDSNPGIIYASEAIAAFLECFRLYGLTKGYLKENDYYAIRLRTFIDAYKNPISTAAPGTRMEVLGSGAFNTVYLITTPSGKYVVKPTGKEGDRHNIANSNMLGFMGIDPKHDLSDERNIATSRMGEFLASLGLSNPYVKTDACCITINGETRRCVRMEYIESGLFMHRPRLAEQNLMELLNDLSIFLPGDASNIQIALEMCDWVLQDPVNQIYRISDGRGFLDANLNMANFRLSRSAKSDIKIQDVKRMGDETNPVYIAVCAESCASDIKAHMSNAEFRASLVEFSILDFLTGAAVDHHGNNYGFVVNPATGALQVRAYDNDLSWPSRGFAWDEWCADTFMVAFQGKMYDIGWRGSSLPNVATQRVYDVYMNIQPETITQMFTGRLNNEQIAFACERLQTIKDWLKALKSTGRIVESLEGQDVHEQLIARRAAKHIETSAGYYAAVWRTVSGDPKKKAPALPVISSTPVVQKSATVASLRNIPMTATVFGGNDSEDSSDTTGLPIAIDWKVQLVDSGSTASSMPQFYSAWSEQQKPA